MLCLLITSAATVGQTYKDSVKRKTGIYYINAGVGHGLSMAAISTSDKILAGTPAISCLVDYSDNPENIVGFGIAFQQWSILNYNDYQYSPMNLENSNETEYRVNAAIRYLFIVESTNNYTSYWGFRLGMSYWQYINYIPATYFAEAYTSKTHEWNVGFQILLGVRKYFTKTIGYHIEVGIGSPYLAEAGLSLRI